MAESLTTRTAPVAARVPPLPVSLTWWGGVALVASLVVALLVPLLGSLDVHPPGRPVLAAAYFFLVPGVPLALALRLPSGLLTAALAAAVSLSTAVVLGTAAIVAGWWHPLALGWALSLVTVLAAVPVLRHRRRTPGRATRPPARPWVVALPDGREIEVSSSVVVGRKPATPAGEEPSELVTLTDESRRISKSHVSLGVDRRGLFVVDLGSTNGSTVAQPGGDAVRSTPSVPVHLKPGAVVTMSDQWLRVLPQSRRSVELALVLVVGLLWLWSCAHLDLDAAGTLGLLPVVGWRFWVVLVLTALLLVRALRQPRIDHVVLAALALLVALVGYVSVGVSDGAGSVPVGWTHVAFVQYIVDYGTVPASVDARFSWPGFFAAGAQLVSLAGVPDARSFLVLASAVYTAAALPALLLIARTVTRSWRLAWTGVLVFVVTNWYQQDYFSPQATAFVIYVSIVAALLWTVDHAVVPELGGSWRQRLRQMVTRTPGPAEGLDVRSARLLGVLLAVCLAGVAIGHQLTPMTLILALVLFSLTGLTRYRLLWLFGGLVFAAYFSYGATDYWVGHLSNVFGDLGQVGASVGSGVAGRLVGDPTYQSAQFVRILWSVLVFLGGAAGALLLMARRRQDSLLLAGLGCAPFALLAVQSYGGEGVIRSFLYASPLLAPLTVVAVHALVGLAGRLLGARTGKLPAWVLSVALVLAVLLSLAVLVFTRGLNVAFERTPRDQVAVSEAVYARAEAGDAVGLPASLGLSPFLRLTEVGITYLDLTACDENDLETCLGETPPRFVLLSITQERSGELTQSRPSGWLWQLGDQLVAEGGYRKLLVRPDAWLLERNGS